MTEWIWFNGEIIPMSQARIGIEDRGFQFADGVYEVVRLYGGKPFALDRHLERLDNSAAGILLPVPLSRSALTAEISRLVEIVAIDEGMIYLQLTRGPAERAHAFSASHKPTLLFYIRPLPPVPPAGTAPGMKIISVPDDRWQRCWIKSIALLPNILAKTQAVTAGADEAVFIDHGHVTECSASNIFAIIGRNLVTHAVGAKVLPGITRQFLLEIAETVGLKPDERPMTEAEGRSADEVFITSTTREISWVAEWDGQCVSPGKCGPLTLDLHRALQSRIAEELGAVRAELVLRH